MHSRIVSIGEQCYNGEVQKHLPDNLLGEAHVKNTQVHR